MKRIISTATAAALLAGALLLPAALRAEDKPEGKPEKHEGKEGHEDFRARMKEKFGISEDQEAKLKAARRAKRDASEAAMSELGAATRKLQDQLEDKASEKDLSATLDKIAAVRKTMRADEDKFEASLSSILTPTQRAKMVVMMKSHMHGHGGGMGRPMGGKHEGPHGKKGEDGQRGDAPEHDDDD